MTAAKYSIVGTRKRRFYCEGIMKLNLAKINRRITILVTIRCPVALLTDGPWAWKLSITKAIQKCLPKCHSKAELDHTSATNSWRPSALSCNKELAALLVYWDAVRVSFLTKLLSLWDWTFIQVQIWEKQYLIVLLGKEVLVPCWLIFSCGPHTTLDVLSSLNPYDFWRR